MVQYSAQIIVNAYGRMDMYLNVDGATVTRVRNCFPDSQSNGSVLIERHHLNFTGIILDCQQSVLRLASTQIIVSLT
jgi:hypothetical protein